MDRRIFVQATAASICAASAGLGADSNPSAGEYYELRTYTLKTDKLPILDEYLKTALLPTLGRLGVGPVGVFSEIDGSEREILTDKKGVTTPEKGTERITVLLVHKNAESALGLSAKLRSDESYLQMAATYLNAKPEDPVYSKLESSLLSAFAGMPKLEKPDPSKPRLFNLRTYQSHNERSAAKKVEMFEKGELDIFRRVGLTPVFFASAVMGASLPNLTYMLVFPDDAGRETAWGKFIKDPAWGKLKATPGYADKEIVSKIVNRILTPRPYSEI